MKNKSAYFIAFFLLFLIFNFSLAQNSFIKVFPMPNSFTLSGSMMQISECKDRGLLIAADCCTNANCSNRALVIIKTDSSGTISWTKHYENFTDAPVFRQFVELPDSSFMFLGGSSLGSNRGIILMRIGSTGSILYSKKITSTGNSIGVNEIKLQNDSTLLISGNFVTGSIAGTGYLLSDLLGNISTNKFYTINNHITYSSAFNALTKANDGGYIICLSNHIYDTIPSNNRYVPSILKTDSLGNILWAHQFDDGIGSVSTNPYKYSLLELDDGSIVVSNQWNKPISTSTLLNGTLLLKLNSNGQLIFSKVFYPFISSPQLILKDNNEIILTGGLSVVLFDTTLTFTSAQKLAANSTGLNFSLLTSDKKLLSAMPFSANDEIYLNKSTFNDTSNCFQQSFNLTDSLLNLTDSTGAVSYSLIFLTSTIFMNTINDSISNIDLCNPLRLSETGALQDHINMFPVPASHFLHIETQNDRNKTISVYDLTGKILLDFELKKAETKIDIRSLAEGIYIVKMFDGERNYCRKLIVEHN